MEEVEEEGASGEKLPIKVFIEDSVGDTKLSSDGGYLDISNCNDDDTETLGDGTLTPCETEDGSDLPPYSEYEPTHERARKWQEGSGDFDNANDVGERPFAGVWQGGDTGDDEIDGLLQRVQLGKADLLPPGETAQQTFVRLEEAYNKANAEYEDHNRVYEKANAKYLEAESSGSLSYSESQKSTDGAGRFTRNLERHTTEVAKLIVSGVRLGRRPGERTPWWMPAVSTIDSDGFEGR